MGTYNKDRFPSVSLALVNVNFQEVYFFFHIFYRFFMVFVSLLDEVYLCLGFSPESKIVVSISIFKPWVLECLGLKCLVEP